MGIRWVTPVIKLNTFSPPHLVSVFSSLLLPNIFPLLGESLSVCAILCQFHLLDSTQLRDIIATLFHCRIELDKSITSVEIRKSKIHGGDYVVRGNQRPPAVL